MNKTTIILLGALIAIVAIYFIFVKSKNMSENTTGASVAPLSMRPNDLKLINDSLNKLYYNDTKKEYAIKAARALKNAGLPLNKIAWSLAQVAHETGHFSNKGSQVDNNLSGIKYVGKPIQDATPGSAAPAREGKTPYAHFKNIDAWAKDYIRILTTVGKARPLEATTTDEFAHRLGLNGYYGLDHDGEKIYKNAIRSLSKSFETLAKLA